MRKTTDGKPPAHREKLEEIKRLFPTKLPRAFTVETLANHIGDWRKSPQLGPGRPIPDEAESLAKRMCTTKDSRTCGSDFHPAILLAILKSVCNAMNQRPADGPVSNMWWLRRHLSVHWFLQQRRQF